MYRPVYFDAETKEIVKKSEIAKLQVAGRRIEWCYAYEVEKVFGKKA